MQFFDDGRIGLSFETQVGTLRLLHEPAHGGRPDYGSVGTLTRMSDRVVKLSGFHGTMTTRHMALIARALHGLGYRALYVERAGSGVVPFGERIADGDFAGEFRVDLAGAMRRIEARYAPTKCAEKCAELGD